MLQNCFFFLCNISLFCFKSILNNCILGLHYAKVNNKCSNGSSKAKWITDIKYWFSWFNALQCVTNWSVFFQLSDPKTSDRYLVSSRSWFHISPGWREFAGIFWQDRTETKNSTSPSSLSVFCRRAHTGKGKRKKKKKGKKWCNYCTTDIFSFPLTPHWKKSEMIKLTFTWFTKESLQYDKKNKKKITKTQT